jgi:hypothetical protein
MATDLRLDDRQLISEVTYRYASGIDLRQWDRYRSCFTDPCTYDFSSWSGTPEVVLPADTWVDNVRRLNGSFDATQHISANHHITFDDDHDDQATCLSYMQAQHFFRPETMTDNDHAGEVNWCTLGGHYTNRLVRTDDGWRIARCQLTVTWDTGNRSIFAIARAIGAGRD